MGRPAGSKNRPRAVDIALLSDEEKAALRREAYEQVHAEQKKAAKDAYRDLLLDEARIEKGLDEPLLTVAITIPEFAANITIDGTIYFHGREYTVPQSRAEVLMETMDRAWAHEREVDTGVTRATPVKRRQAISPRGVVTV